MCRAKDDGDRRCEGRTAWYVNSEAHVRWGPDAEQERHWHKPRPLLSMTPGAIRTRRHRAEAYAREVTAMRTLHGVAIDEPIGPALREVLWQARYRGAGLSLLTLADRFRALAKEEGVPVERVADRYATQHVRPYRASAGERLAHLCVDATRPDWVDPERLVSMVSPVDNGTPSKAYVRVVSDLDGVPFTLVTSFDGSEPMAFAGDTAGLKLAASEALSRVRAVNDDPDAYETWLDKQGMSGPSSPEPWTQDMSTNDFLSHSDRFHLV